MCFASSRSITRRAISSTNAKCMFMMATVTRSTAKKMTASRNAMDCLRSFFIFFSNLKKIQFFFSLQHTSFAHSFILLRQQITTHRPAPPPVQPRAADGTPGTGAGGAQEGAVAQDCVVLSFDAVFADVALWVGVHLFVLKKVMFILEIKSEMFFSSIKKHWHTIAERMQI